MKYVYVDAFCVKYWDWFQIHVYIYTHPALIANSWYASSCAALVAAADEDELLDDGTPPDGADHEAPTPFEPDEGCPAYII